jgi:sarcosine oxidase subunit gamma
MLNRQTLHPVCTNFVGFDGPDGQRRVRIGEVPATTWFQLGVYPGGAAEIAGCWLSTFGFALPESATRVTESAGRRMYRVAPDQYFLAGFSRADMMQLEAALPLAAGGLTDLCGARIALQVSGAHARELLSQLVTIDLDPVTFPIGHFAQTGIHHVGGLLERTGPETYIYLGLRTYAQTLWEAFVDAARPIGCDALSAAATSHV